MDSANTGWQDSLWAAMTPPGPFTQPMPIVAHGLLRPLAPLMLMVYRRRDAKEMD